MNKMLLIVSAFLMLRLALTADNYIKFENVSYGPHERNKMDMFFPPSNLLHKTFGAILFIHGGGWVKGDKSSAHSLCKTNVMRGYITATMNYHYIKNGNTIYDVMEDIQKAIKKLKEVSQIGSYEINGLALCGKSAGGHLASLFAYAFPDKSPIKLKFLINFVGPSDLHSETWNDLDYNEKTGPKYALQLAGIDKDPSKVDKSELETLIKKFSPANHITAKSLPTICVYGEKDTIVPFANAMILYNKLEQKKIKHDFYIFPKSGHSLDKDPDLKVIVVDRIYAYCAHYFGYLD